MRTLKLHQNAAPFLTYLQRYRHDRGALANLRGALSDARRPNAWPLLAAFKEAIGNSAFETIAALWAFNPELNVPAGNLGDILAKLKGENSSFEGRFKRLLTCDRGELAVRVAPVVRAAQAKGLRVNYTQLLSDLLWWGEEVKVRWAKSFWEVSETDDAIIPLDTEGPS